MQKVLVLATALSSLTSGARAEPWAVHNLMCNSPAQVEQFAEAALGAGLSIEDAQLAVNNAAGDAQACVFVPVVVENVHDEKQLRYNGQTYVIRRVDVVALMRQTEIGWISQAIAPRVQFSLAVKEKLRRIMLPSGTCAKRHRTLARSFLSILATPPSRVNWILEIVLDCWRLQNHSDGTRIRVFSPRE